MLNHKISPDNDNDHEKLLIEVKNEIRAITNTMYNVASGDEQSVPSSKKELSNLAEALYYLADKRLQLENLFRKSKAEATTP